MKILEEASVMKTTSDTVSLLRNILFRNLSLDGNKIKALFNENCITQLYPIVLKYRSSKLEIFGHQI